LARLRSSGALREVRSLLREARKQGLVDLPLF
jgi:hypothetical protein